MQAQENPLLPCRLARQPTLADGAALLQLYLEPEDATRRLMRLADETLCDEHAHVWPSRRR